MTIEIPIIDLSSLSQTVHPDPSNSLPLLDNENGQQLTEKVFKAMSQVGFMYLVNHGIDENTIKNAFEESEKFFHLPASLKENHIIDMTQHFRGYTAPGQQILSADTFHEFCERFSIEAPDPNGSYEVSEVPNLVSSLEKLRQACQPVVRILLNLEAKALKIEDDQVFVKTYNGGHLHHQQNFSNRSMMRTHYYPKIPEDTIIPKGSVRCSEHKDWGIMTLLFQDNMGGLEVKSVDGTWIQATPIPGSILVNTGEIMEWWTGNVFPATAHRVLIPESEILKRTSRQSVVFFVNADNDTIISPLKSKLIDYKGHDMETFEPIRFNDHYQGRFNMTYKY